MMNFNEIKSAWDEQMKYYMPVYKEKGVMYIDPYFYEWNLIFSPIEILVWNDIRSFGVPIYPQFPACGYFLDFANPFIKIAVECDGKQFHDKEKDRKRDNKLIDNGWKIYRLTGRVCKRTINLSDYEDEEEYLKMKDIWLNETSEGFMYGLNLMYFKDHSNLNDEYRAKVFSAVESKRSFGMI